MTLIRTALFWLHLAAGVVAGTVVLIMSVTGVALTYEKQLLEWADRQAWAAPPPSERLPLAPEMLLARVSDARPDAVPTTLTLRSNPASPATVALAGQGTLLVDPYSGAIIGPPPAGLRSFFRTMTSWHRWLAMDGPGRATGRAITGGANLAFLFIVVSGIYLWVPRIWSRVQFRHVLWFRPGLTGKARDFNWHNVIGIWSAIPLAIVVAGAVPISYPWASNLVYRIVGEEPPRAPQGPPGGPPGQEPGRVRQTLAAGEPPRSELRGLDAAFQQAVGRVPSWRVVSIRVPSGEQPSLIVTIDQGDPGQPQHRGTLTVARGSGDGEKWESFRDLSAGRRLRSWLRFAHTGEYYGLFGQTVAGLVSAGAVVLVWTGIALACRRLVACMNRTSQPGAVSNRRAA